MAYTTINEDIFYIQGGTLITGTGTSTSNSTQFYALDLTQPTWNTLNPPWKELTYPSYLAALSSNTGQSISVAPDSSSFTMWSSDPNLIVTYNIASGTWTQVLPAPPTTLFSGNDLQAATDLTTGLVYIPGAASTSYNTMSVYRFSTGMSPSVAIPSTLIIAGGYYTFVWSQVRKTFIYFGGNSTTLDPFIEFSPTLNKWSTLPTEGSIIPPFKIRSCMVPAYNGTKMLLFGGNTDTTESVDTLHILDLATMKWTQAPSSLDARSDMACSVSGDNFIVWGGYKRNPVNAFVPSSPTPIIYNIYLGKWTTTFTRGSHPNGSTYPTPTPTWNPNPPKKPINGAAIGGGVAVGMVVIAAIAFFFLRRRRQTRKQHQPPAVPSKETEAAHQEQGHRDRILASNEDPLSGPAPYTYSLINSGINHNYSQINPGVTFNNNTNNGYSNNSFNNNYTHANNYNYDQTPQVFAMTERHSQPNSPQASSGSASTWKTGTTYSPTTPTYIPTSPTSPTYASSYSTAYSTPPIPARPKHISNTIATPIDPSNQDHIRELEYQIEMSNRQLEYALRNLKCAPAVATVNNPQYNPILPELEPPSTVLTRGPQGTDIQMVPMTTTPGAPQLDQTELVHKIEKMQSELRNLHAQLST